MIAPTDYTARIIVALWAASRPVTARELEVAADTSERSVSRHLNALVEHQLARRHPGRPPIYVPHLPNPKRIPAVHRDFYTSLGVRLELIPVPKAVEPIRSKFLTELARRRGPSDGWG